MSQAGREIELKFHCAPGDLDAVLAAAPAGVDEVRDLISVYFDTPDRALERAGVSLRVRESKGRRIQTLKRGKGLTREEHEQPVEGFAPDPNSEPLRQMLAPEAAGTLSPAFHVDIHRRQRLVRRGRALIEIALDQGEVRAGEGVSPICEVELELKAGPPAALFALARELSAAAPLYLSFEGKAAAGQALTGDKPAARRSEPVRLRRDATTAEVFQAAARAALVQIAANAGALREAADTEAVHQLRVGARRLRSALSTFRPILQDSRRERVKGEVKWLAQACDDARDLDVFVAGVRAAAKGLKTPPPGLGALVAVAETARDAALAAARTAVGSARFRALLLEATAWTEDGPWLRRRELAGLRAAKAVSFAAAALERQRETLRKRARRFERADAERRHEVRIEAKKLRYGGDIFASLYAPKSVGPLIASLKALQEELGALNDAAVAERLAPLLIGDAATGFAAGEIAGLRVAETPGRIRRAGKALKRLMEAKPLWR